MVRFAKTLKLDDVCSESNVFLKHSELIFFILFIIVLHYMVFTFYYYLQWY
jgi:hypothetical protein